MAEQEVVIDVQWFPKDQHVSDLPFKDPVAAFMELYFSESWKVSDFFSSPMFSGEYGFQKEFLLLLLHFRTQLLINDRYGSQHSLNQLQSWLE
jgi:hypothetical protein